MPRLYSKKVFDLTTLEIILSSLGVEKCSFSAYICLQWKFVTILFFYRSIQFESMENCFILWTDVSGVNNKLE